jgi:hypothetical protein
MTARFQRIVGGFGRMGQATRSYSGARALRYAFIFGTALVFWPWTTDAQTKPPLPSKDEAKRVLEVAVEKTNLHGTGSSPYHLRVKVKSFRSKSETTDGTYEFWWTSPDRWREEATWLEKTAVRIADNDLLWTEGEDLHRSSTLRLSDLLDFWAYLRTESHLHIRRVHSKTFDGVLLACIEAGEEMPAITGVLLLSIPSVNWGACLDPGTNLPVYIQRASLRLDLSNYTELGTKRFPRELRRILDGKPQIEAHVESLETFDPAQASVFQPSKGAASRPWCPSLVGPVPLHFGGAPYSPSSLAAGSLMIPLPPDFGRFGLLIFDVDDTGHPLDVEAFKHGGQIPIKDSDKRTLLKSVFKPATCANKPIQAEFQIEPPH